MKMPSRPVGERWIRASGLHVSFMQRAGGFFFDCKNEGAILSTSMSHPWFTLLGGVFCVWVIYLLAKIFIEIEKRSSELRCALDGLLRISVCRCNNAGTCAYCNAI